MATTGLAPPTHTWSAAGLRRQVRPALVVSLDAIGRLPLRLVVPVTDGKPQYASYP